MQPAYFSSVSAASVSAHLLSILLGGALAHGQDAALQEVPVASVTPAASEASKTGRRASEASFAADYARAQDLARAGSWRPAWNAWLALLREHGGAEYVRPRLPDLREALKNASFWMDRRRPEPSELVSGRLESYWRRKGRLRITYTPLTLGDFERQDEMLVHPARFRGPYTLKLSGEEARLALQAVAVAIDGDDLWQVSLGNHLEGDRYYTPHQLVRVADGKPLIADLAEPRSRRSGGRRLVQVVIRVTRRTIEVDYGGQTVLTGRKVNDTLGSFGFGTAPGFAKLSVDGIVEPAWLEGLADEALQEQRAVFEASWREPAELVPWNDGPAPAGSWEAFGGAARRVLSRIPVRAEIPPRIAEVLEGLSELEAGEAEERLRALPEGELSPAEREHAIGLVWAAAGRMLAALEHLDEAARLDEPPLELEITRARLRWKVEDHDRAVDELRELSDRNPGDLPLLEELGDLLLSRGAWTEARARIEAGLEASPANAALEELLDQVVKAEQGPTWSRPWVVDGPHFSVVSDLDSNVCKTASREVERTLSYCEDLLGPLPHSGPDARPDLGLPVADGAVERRRIRGLPVYLFSGRAGYARYVEGVEARSPEHSYGMYSRRLHQILVWNVPSRALLENVLRHECVHHYIELSVGEAPPWLHEGLAEYVAAAGTGKEWAPGAPYEERLVTLRANGWETVPLAEFLFMGHEEFLERAGLHYAQAWVLVDFLLGPRRTHRGFFDRLWNELRGPADAGTAVERALGNRSVAELEKDFREHLTRFRRR